MYIGQGSAHIKWPVIAQKAFLEFVHQEKTSSIKRVTEQTTEEGDGGEQKSKRQRTERSEKEMKAEGKMSQNASDSLSPCQSKRKKGKMTNISH